MDIPKSRRRGRTAGRKTARSYIAPATCDAVEKIAHAFTTVLTTIRKFHWNTDVYSHHKITDDLYSQIDGHADRFVETLKGKLSPPTQRNATGTQKEFGKKKFEASLCRTVGRAVQTKLNLYHLSNPDINIALFEFREFLESLSHIFHEEDGDLLSIRDDMLVDVNRGLFLLVMK